VIIDEAPGAQEKRSGMNGEHPLKKQKADNLLDLDGATGGSGVGGGNASLPP